MNAVSRLLPALFLGLAGCGAQVVPPAVGFTPASPPPAKGGVIGATARALIAQYGAPRLDIRDPTARKLQFGNDQCVIDVYLYAPGERKEPVVTYADARRVTSGEAMTWQACAKALEPKAP